MEILPDDAPAPRLCHLIKWQDFDGYGFNLHAERSNPGQFIGKIDDQSPAQMAGLREGDRIVEVNGVNINNENHRQVVERIKSIANETRLLVVDAEADAYYREHDLVIKSSQINVVYCKTPVPRPAPDSPRATFHAKSAASSSPEASEESASSLSPTSNGSGALRSESSLPTSDFNDDSIEPAEQAEVEKRRAISSPPMSPDSGKGDEEATSQTLINSSSACSPPQAVVELTIEAEINRQSPQQQLTNDELNEDDHQLINSTQHQQNNKAPEESNAACELIKQSAKANQVSEELKDADKTASRVATRNVEQDKQQDSLTAAQQLSKSNDSLEPSSCKAAHNNGSVADSGQSSSQSSSSSGSIADSLEVNSQHQPEAEPEAEGHEQRQTSAREEDGNVDGGDIVENVPVKPQNTLTTPTNATQTQQELPLPMSIQSTKQQTNNNNNSIPSSIKQQATEATPINSKQGNNNNSNYNGLNLNMTASEMRELLARKKKFDVKKAQMNIRQKYEIVQQM